MTLTRLWNQSMVQQQKALEKERYLQQKALKKERYLRRLMKPWKIHMNNHQEEDALKKERNLKMYGSNNAPHQEVQNHHNMMILNKMLKTINKRSHQWTSMTTQWVKRLSISGKQKIHQMILKTLW